MAQSHAAPRPPRGDGNERKEGADCNDASLMKNEIIIDEHHSRNGGAIIDAPNNIIPVQKINNKIMEENNQPPSLESSTDDGDAVMEDVAASGKPPSGGEDHVEGDTTTTAIRSYGAITAASKDDAACIDSKSDGAPAKPLALNLQSPPVGGDDAAVVDARQQNILSSIQHRRQLLAWVRESRIACEQSRNNVTSGTKMSFVAAILDDHAKEVEDTNTSPSGRTTSSTTDEVADYKKVAKLANSALALQRKKSSTAISENVAQRELRRGYSIGKRMSAAVSTLNNSGNVGGWTSSTDCSISADAASSSSAVPPNNVTSSTAMTNNTKSSQNKPVFPPSVGKHFDPTTTAQSSLSKVAAEKLLKKARKRASNIKKSGVVCLDESSNTFAAALPTNANPISAHNSTPCWTLSASAVRLRDRRDELAKELKKLVINQHRSNSGEKRKADEAAEATAAACEKSPFTSHKRPKDARAKATQSSLTKLLSLSEMGNAKEAPRLPPRRMTQWDCILEEMRWMASDFIEERKWKLACGKLLSSSVKQYVEDQKLVAKSAKGKSKSTPNTADDKSIATETPSSSIATSTKPTMIVDTKFNNRRKLSISDSNPLYVDPSNEDVELSRKISQLLSLTVSDHWDVVLSKGVFPLTDDSYKVGYERFRKVTGELLGETSEVRLQSSINDLTPIAQPAFPELNFDDISKKLNESVKYAFSLKAKTNDALEKERVLQKYRKSFTHGVDLSYSQIKAVHFIESVWGSREETSVAALIGGDVGRGKTIACCSILWKNRFTGPQLILCSPALLLRWKHELSKFEDLNVKVFGHGGWTFRADDINCTSVGTHDVLLCDYSSFIEMAFDKNSSAGRNTPAFASLTLDCRHPSVPNKERGKIPVEIESAEWWNRLVQFSMRFSSLNRLVIEHSWNQLCPADLDDGDKEMIDCKVMAMKLAFMYDPANFFSSHSSIGKRVISWAKRQDVVEGKSPSLLMLRSVLTASLRKIYDSALMCIDFDQQHPEKKISDEIGAPNASNVSWEIRKCSLAALQQIEYNQHCSNKMTFSGASESANTEFADTILMLRKICFHATVDDATAALLSPLLRINRNLSRSVDGSMIVRKSSQMAEPCFTTASSLLLKSSKLKELLRMLTAECGHDIPDELTQFLSIDLDPSSTRKKKAKVIILATLTEAQLLTSHFLSAIGLHHEVLLSFQTKGSSFLPTDASAWAWSQNVISQFNDDCIAKGNHPHRFIDILVASPITLSSHSCGIGATSADFVISIDEDWSGREEMHVASFRSKLRGARKNSKPPCKFVKIVSKSTCEYTFLCKGNTVKVDTTMPETSTLEKAKSVKKTRKRGRSHAKKNQDENENATTPPNNNTIEYQVCPRTSNLSRVNVAMNENGYLPPVVVHEESCTSVVGSNVLRHRNCSLSDVYCTPIGSSELFIPKVDEVNLSMDVSMSDQLQFQSALYRSEHKAFHSFVTPTAMLRSITLSNFCPPQICIHPRDVLSDRDLSSVPVRCFAASLSKNIRSVPERKRHNLLLFQSEKTEASSLKEDKSAENTPMGDTFEVAEIDTEIVDSATLLVYELSPDKLTEMNAIASRKRKNAISTEAVNVFSSLFEVYDNSTGFSRDGHQGVEMSVYAPSLLPLLLDVAWDTVFETISLPQDNGTSSNITKRDVDEISSELFTSDASAKSQLLQTAAPSVLNDSVSAQSCGLSHEHYLFEVETNPYSLPVQRNNESLDTLFGNGLAGCDAKGAIFCQAWPLLTSMILLTEKKNENVSGDQEKKVKKSKNHHNHPKTLAALDTLSIPYFRKEKITRRALYATKKVKIDEATSIAGSVSLRSRLGDIMIGSASLPASSHHTSAANDFGSMNQTNSSGIILPIGVKKPELCSKLSRSLKETLEAWSEKEDALLKETLARYGLNWQLASHAISVAFSSRRSPSQCSRRWESLIGELPINAVIKNNDKQNASKMFLRFNNNPWSNDSKSLIYNKTSYKSDLNQRSAQRTAFQLIGSFSSSAIATTIGAGVEKEHILSRIAKLRDTSKKRRVVKISLPGATTTGTETIVRLSAIHPSHAESVHVARSNLSHGVAPARQEMWPLELLDHVEKQRKAAALNTNETQRGTTSHHAQSTSQPSNHQLYPPQQTPMLPTPHSSTPTHHPVNDPHSQHQQKTTTAHDKPPSTKGPS